jgi:hypothetical protein
MVVQQGLELSGADLADPQDSGKETDDFDDSAYESDPSPRRRPKGCLQIIQHVSPAPQFTVYMWTASLT